MLFGGSSLEVNSLGEPNSFSSESLRSLSNSVLVGKHASSDDLDGFGSSTVSATHFHVHLGDCSVQSSVSVFFVHVHGDSSGQVSEEDSVVLDSTSFFLEDLASGNNLTLDLSNLVLSLHEVPELGSGEHGVSSKHTHSVESGLGVSLTWQSSTDNEELSNLYK